MFNTSPALKLTNHGRQKRSHGTIFTKKIQLKAYSYCDSQKGDEYIRYDVSYVSAHVISVAWSDYTYCNGAPHGFLETGGDNRVLDQGSRELVPSDVFATGWKEKLQRLFLNALLETGWKPRDDEEKRSVLDTVTEPKKWVFTHDGLSVSFGAYDSGCYACNPRTTTIRWINLMPLLTAGSLLH